MKPRPAAVPPPPAPEYRRWCGIDPGATVGLCSLVVPNVGPRAYDVNHARLIATDSVSATTAKAYTSAGARATLLLRVRHLLSLWRVTDVVIEEASEVKATGFKGASGQWVTGQATGTHYYAGAHFGLCLGAAVTLPWPVRVWSYPPTTPKRGSKMERGTEDVLRGWMQGHANRATPREHTLANMHQLLRALKQRPADGSLPNRDEVDREHVAHERMALGVLNYHLNRERGRA